MTIYTTAARVAKHNVCEGGQERTAAALAAQGKTMDTVVTMQNILHSLGTTDALYSFVEVEPGSEKEAAYVLGEYCRQLAGMVGNVLIVNDPGLATVLAEVNKTLNKRCDGVERPQLQRRAWAAVMARRQARTVPEVRYWLQAYAELLAPKPAHIRAVHATAAFIDGCRAAKIENEGQQKVYAILDNLLGNE